MRQRNFSRTATHSTAANSLYACSLVRHSKITFTHYRNRRRQKSCQTVNSRYALRFFQRQKRQKPWKFLQCKRFPTAGRSKSKQIMSTGSSNLQSANQFSLSANFRHLKTFINRRKKHIFNPNRTFWRSLVFRKFTPFTKNFRFIKRIKRLCKIFRRKNLHSANFLCFAGILRAYNAIINSCQFCGSSSSMNAPDRTQKPRKLKFAHNKHTFFRKISFLSIKNCQRKRQIKTSAFFFQIRRRQTD